VVTSEAQACYSKIMERYESGVYSIGHGSRATTAFVSILRSFTVQHVADIRSYPGSRGNPQFNQESFRECVVQAGISYTWFPHLGGLRRKGLGIRSPHATIRQGRLVYASPGDGQLALELP
jgi:hypothetical protein